MKESEWDDVAWIHLAQDRAKKRAAVNTIMDLRLPQHLGNFLSRWWANTLSRTLLHVVSLLVSRSPRTARCKISAECRAVYNKISDLKNMPPAVQISATNLPLWVTIFLPPFRINFGNIFKTITNVNVRKYEANACLNVCLYLTAYWIMFL